MANTKLILTENQLELVMTAIEWAYGSCVGISKEEDETLHEYYKRFRTLDEQVTRQIQKSNAKKAGN